jgi:hypothetical protein
MQVRQVLIATLLAASAVGAMSQEIDRSETLQARNLAAQQAQAQPLSRDSVAAESRAAEASDPIAADATPNISWAKLRATKTYSKAWLHGDRKQTRTAVAERG